MLDKMPKRCSVCDLDLVREVGFYYGAMMISHALTTVIAVIVHFTVFHFYGWEIAPHLIILLSIILGLFPVVFRVARAIWINLFIKYEPNYIIETKDCNGNLLNVGDTITLIKDLKLKGSSTVLKRETTVKSIKLTDDPSEID